jgi:hypothetical protein
LGSQTIFIQKTLKWKYVPKARWGFQFGLTKNIYPKILKYVQKVGWGFPAQTNEQLFFKNKI